MTLIIKSSDEVFTLWKGPVADFNQFKIDISYLYGYEEKTITIKMGQEVRNTLKYYSPPLEHVKTSDVIGFNEFFDNGNATYESYVWSPETCSKIALLLQNVSLTKFKQQKDNLCNGLNYCVNTESSAVFQCA